MQGDGSEAVSLSEQHRVSNQTPTPTNQSGDCRNAHVCFQFRGAITEIAAVLWTTDSQRQGAAGH